MQNAVYEPQIQTSQRVPSPNEPPDIPLSVLFKAFWKARNFVVTIIGASVVLSFVYLATSQRAYSVETVIGPAQDSSGGAKSALAGITGALFGGGDTDVNFSKFRQILTSARLADRLEKDHRVAKTLMGGWDEQTHSWLPPSGPLAFIKGGLKALLGLPGWAPPDSAQLAGQLHEIVQIERIGQGGPLDMKTNLLIVSVKMADKNYAIQLLNWILRDADHVVREDQLTNTTNRIGYLRDALSKTNEVNLIQSLQQILMNEERTQMMLQADKYYAVDVIDPPHYNPSNYSPRPSLVVFSAILLGLLVSMGIIYIIFRRRMALAQREEDIFATPFPNPIWYAATKIRNLAAKRRGRKYDANT